MSERDLIGLDDQGRAIISTRAWSRVLEANAGELVNQPPNAPIKLAEAYMPAPIAWMMLAGSSQGPASNVILSVAFGNVEGSINVPAPLAGAGFTVGLGGPVIAATSIVVSITNPGALVAGERISVSIAPVVWPDWPCPEQPRRLAGVGG